MTTTTPTRVRTVQQDRAGALCGILAISGVADASWSVDTSVDVYDWAGLVGQLERMPLDKARAAIAAYASALGLEIQPEQNLTDFTQVRAFGTYASVTVRVWAPGVPS